MVKSFFLKLMLLSLISQFAFAQVSDGEGVTPLEGVQIVRPSNVTNEAQREDKFWDETKAIGNWEAFEAYINAYPKGRYVNLAKANLSQLNTTMTGSAGTPVDTGVAPKASGPSASYIGRLRAKVKPNITFPDNLLQNVVGNPTAAVEVTCSPSGKIEDVNLVKSSGNNAWDEAVRNGLRKTAMLPRDVDGSMPTRLVFSFRPRD